MRSLVLSSSLDPASRSERLAQMYAEALSGEGVEVEYVSLKDHPLPRFDNGPELLANQSYRKLHEAARSADGLVFASPVYNWMCSAALKQFLEVVGTTPPDGSARSPFFDKVISFINSAGIDNSYMAFSSTAISMMLDYKCIVNPYIVYVDNHGWDGDELREKHSKRLQRSARIMADLIRRLAGRGYSSRWEV